MEFIEVLSHELATLREEYINRTTIYERRRDEANDAQKQVNTIARKLHALEDTLRAYDRSDRLVYQETA